MSQRKHDPANYRKLAEPFADAEVANSALDAFFADVSAARQRHGIRDALVIMSGAVIYPDGEGDFTTLAYFGDQRNAPVLAAYAFGQTQAEMREKINRIASGERKTK